MPISRDDLSAELKNNLFIGLSIGVIGGGVVGFLMVATTLFLNPGFLRSLPDLMVLTGILVGVYIVLALGIGLAGALLKTLFFLFNKQRLSDTKTAAFAIGAFFFVLVAAYGITWCRWNGVGGASREGLLQVDALPIYLVVLGVSLILSRLFTYAMYVLIVYWKKPHLAKRGDWTKAFFVLGYVALFTILFMVVIRATTASDTSHGEGLTPADLHPQGTAVEIVGLDGMTRDRLLALGETNSVPGLALFLERAAWVRLDPGMGLIPPIQWTSLVTGQTYRRHGITDYKVETLRGLRTPLWVRPGQVGVYEAFNHVLPFFRLTESLALRSQMRQSKALWDLADEAGLTSCVVGWWATWPAEKLRGATVTDHAYMKLRTLLEEKSAGDGSATWDRSVAGELEAETYPQSLLLELADLLRDAGTPPASEALPSSLFEADHLYAEAAILLAERLQPELSLLYLPGPDVMKRVLYRENPRTWRDEFSALVPSYFEFLSPSLGAIFDGGRDGVRALVILPGWQEEDADGWLILAGPSVEPGVVTDERFNLSDAAATLIHLAGLPIAQDLPGRPVLDVLEGERHTVATIPSYGLRPLPENLDRPAGPDREMLERLRSLGYIGS